MVWYLCVQSQDFSKLKFNPPNTYFLPFLINSAPSLPPSIKAFSYRFTLQFFFPSTKYAQYFTFCHLYYTNLGAFFLYKPYCEVDKVSSMVLSHLLDGDEVIFFPYYFVFLNEFFYYMSWFTINSLAPLRLGETVGTFISCCHSLPISRKELVTRL